MDGEPGIIYGSRLAFAESVFVLALLGRGFEPEMQFFTYTYGMEIRPPHPSEYGIVRELSLSHLSADSRKLYLTMNPESAELTEGMINGTKGVCLLALIDGAVAGYVMGAIKNTPLTSVRFAELVDIKVRGDFRNRGIGGQLAEAFIGWGKERADRICVTAHSKNTAAIRFYERLGFMPQSLELELEY